MSRSAATAIDDAHAAGRSALVIYLPVGFPDVATSIDAARAAVEAGADAIELGVPYSDPGIDGPVNVAAMQQALAGGTRTADVLRAVDAVAQTGAAALVMTYYNPVLRYGVDAFARDLASAGGAGLITPDLIPDEAGDWVRAADRHDLDKVFLVAPSSTDERLAATVAASRGFVYAAATMGVTGVRSSVDAAAAELVRRTRGAGAARVCVGIGVSTGAQAAEVASFADGVIVGSAAVRALGSAPGPAGVEALAGLVGELRAGIEDGAA